MSVRTWAALAAWAVAGCATALPELGRPARPKAAVLAPRPTATTLPVTPVVVHEFQTGPMPTGVAVGKTGRTFVCFPRWGDPVPFTVAEIRGGRVVPYPDETFTRLDPSDARRSLVSVQSVVCDAHDRLWILDTGSLNFGPVVPGGPKLVAVDLKTDKVVRTIQIPPGVALPTTYLNDVRLDLSRGGAEGTAYVTDSSDTGPNGIVVVDLATGTSRRRLNDHPSTKAETTGDPSAKFPGKFVATVEGLPLLRHPVGDRPAAAMTAGADGIALSPDGRTLYYSALSGHHLYSVDADALSDGRATDADVAETVVDLGDRGFASDGLACDSAGRLYLTDYEHDAVRVRDKDGKFALVASDPRMVWPDSMALGPDGFLNVTCNQLNRSPAFHGGVDLRRPPFVLFKLKVDAEPSRPGA